VPFDTWGWALVALSLVGLTAVSKGEWLDVFGALFVRQSYSTLDKNKSLILLLFAAIVLTCGYESIISSTLIVPPSVLVARRLKDLVDAGYGILGYDGHVDNASIVLILRREKISYSSVNEPPFIPNTAHVKELSLLLSCNATTAKPPRMAYLIQDWINQRHLWFGIRCHIVKETRISREQLIIYSGYFPSTVHTFVRSFQE
jgi:hypothetical protein